MPSRADKRTKKISAPANEKEIEEYQKACKAVNVEPADTLRKLAAAFVTHVEVRKSFTFPIKFHPTKPE